VAVTDEDLIATYPRLWHMAQDGSWPSIQRLGLLSTTKLLDHCQVRGNQRTAIESHHRPESVEIAVSGQSKIIVRDQKPMSDDALRKCLQDGLTPQQWYETLNSKTFFWTSRARLRRLLAARAYRNQPQTVLTVRTSTLVAAHRKRILLSPINSGSTIFNPQPRGLNTFVPIAEYPFDQWRKKRNSKASAVAELVVSEGVTDIKDHVLAVHRVVNGDAEMIWKAACWGADDTP
jgi:hypothetical protein